MAIGLDCLSHDGLLFYLCVVSSVSTITLMPERDGSLGYWSLFEFRIGDYVLTIYIRSGDIRKRWEFGLLEFA